uniref:Docking protein 1 n=1 Tax=Varanus komodoensis TaxID=61221 RepID=A0A8D2L8M4_VARKO
RTACKRETPAFLYSLTCRVCLQRWKKSWFVLYPASSHGVARLEFFDCKEGAVAADRVCTKRLDKKIVRLADCVSIAPAPECSAKEGLSVFRLETSERTYVFAAEPQEVTEWVARLCETAFPVSGLEALRALEMATNSIYDSREEGRSFRVTVQKTEAAERCRLRGPYVLRASRSSLALAEPHSSSPLYTWPYRLLRRYGRDKVMFSFEAGRRCESGPGNFAFETKQGNEIFHVVQAAIQAQKAQVEENRQSSGSLDAEAAGWPCTPPRSPLPGVPSEDVANVYAEPLDAVKGSRPRPDTLYADPVDTRREGGVGQESWPQATKVLYEQVGPGPSSHQGLSSGKVHIYDEPEGRALLPAPASAPAAIYDEACLPCEAWRTQARESQAGYELPFLPGAGDYAVPAFHQKAGPKAPKPCPAPKLPRARRKSPQPGSNGAPRAPSAPERNGLLGGSGNSSNNNSNASRELLAGEHGTEEPLYSRVLRLPPGRAGHPGPEQSVDGSRPASVYEDLGEI